MGSSFFVNGKEFNVQGENITITNGRVIVDGKDITDEVNYGDEKNVTLNIIIEGELDNLEINKCQKITINGNIKGSITTSNSLEVNGTIFNGASAGNSLSCQDISGNVSAGNSVKCNNVTGNISAGGSVRHG